MKLFVQSRSIEEIRQMANAGLVDGVTVSLAEVMDAEADGDLKEQVTAISQALAVPICVPVPAVTQADLYRDGRELARGLEQLVLQVPFLEDTVLPIRKLVADGVKVCATHVYNGAQAFLAAKVGASMVTVQADILDEHGQRSAEVIAEIRDVLDRADLECELMVSAVTGTTTFMECLLAGANSICVSPTMLRGMMVHALTDRSIDRFLRDLSRRRTPRSN
ncbi:MAG TPA: transaldolase family protein [Gemmatimonadaceae bacterium]|jgi:transaldolase|nr:transaldolase family protein [Gemmatimonadaceae bacterium]